jgi:hypothetical protein
MPGRHGEKSRVRAAALGNNAGLLEQFHYFPKINPKLFEQIADSLVPGGGVEPPRPEGRRILSPLRLPVPPSRLYLQVHDFTTSLWLCSLFV